MKAQHNTEALKTTLCRRSLRIVTTLSLLLGVLVPAFAQAAAPSSNVPFVQALTDARKVAATHEGWKVFLAQGKSMEPEFGGTSLLMAANTKFESLKPGMLVVYRDSVGDMVAHRLVERTEAGWVVKGLNNEKVDPGLVTAQNLQGVVFGTLNFKNGTDKVLAMDAGTAPTVAYAKRY